MKTVKNTKYNKESGMEITEYRVVIKQKSNTHKFTEQRKKILLSNDKNYVIENTFGSLEILDKHNNRNSSLRQFNKCHVYEFKWGIKSMENELICNFVTSMSRNTAIKKIKREMLKYCQEKLYIYSGAVGLIEEIK